MDCVEVLRRSFQLAEPVLEEVVGAVEVGAQAAGRRRPVLAGERLLAGSAKELPVNADEKPCSDARVSLLESQFRLKSVCQHVDEARHHLELLRLQGGGLLDDPRAGREPGAAQARALAGPATP